MRQLLGWTVAQEEVIAAGDVVADDWIVLGQWTDEDVRLRVQRNWLRGAATGRDALVVQFSAGGAPFPETLVPGTTFAADLAFWPSACPQRALVTARRGTAAPWTRPLPGHETVDGKQAVARLDAGPGRRAGSLDRDDDGALRTHGPAPGSRRRRDDQAGAARRSGA